MSTPEARVKAAWREAAKAVGALVVNPIGGPYAELGVSDTLLCLNGRFVAVEIKADAPVPNANQMAFIRRVVGAGGVAGCFGGKNLTTRHALAKEFPALVGCSGWLWSEGRGSEGFQTADCTSGPGVSAKVSAAELLRRLLAPAFTQ